MGNISGTISTKATITGFIDLDVIYFARFWNQSKTKQYRIHIKKTGFNGLATEIINLSDEPLILNHIDNNDNNIQGTELIFNFISHKDNFEDYDALSVGTSFEYQFLVYDPANMELMEHLWKGFILPSETNRSYFNNYSVYTITATDYLSKLKDIEFTDIYGLLPKTRFAIVNIIGWCLHKIPNLIASDKTLYYIQAGVTETNLTSPQQLHPFDYLYLNPRVFTKIRNGLNVGDSCFDVLDTILKTFNLRLCTWFKTISDFDNGTPDFFITNVDEVESNISVYQIDDNDNFSFRDKTTQVNNSLDITNYTFSRESELSRNVPLKTLEILQHNYDYGETFDADDFSDLDNTGIWTKTDLGTITESNGVYSCSIASDKTAGNFTTTDGYTLTNTSGNKYVVFSFTIKNTSSTAVLSSISVTVELLRLVNGSYWSLGYGDTSFSFWGGMTFNYKSPITAPFEISDGATYKFKITIHNITFLTPSARSFEISNISITTGYFNNGESLENVIFDDLYEGFTEPGLTPSKSIELKIGDSLYNRNASAITLSTSDNDVTETWKRYGKTESKPLWELIMQSMFNRYGGAARQLKLKVYDPNDNIKLSKKIVFDNNTYQILDIKKEFYSSWCSLRLQQIATSDLSLTIIKKAISQTNQSTGSSTGTGSSPVLVAGKHSILSGLEFDDHKQYRLRSEAIVSITTGTTLNATHAGKIIECSGTFTLTLPNGMANGMQIDIVNIGTGTITIAASTTLQSEGSKTKLATQYTGASAYHRGSNIWLLVGKLTA